MLSSNVRYQFDSGSSRQALIEALLQKRGLNSSSSCGVIPKRAAGPARLSFAQERLWFLEQMAPGNAVYNVPLALRVRGPLNTELMARAIREIVLRHESLRTVFRAENGEPKQAPARFADSRLPIVNLDRFAPDERDRRVERRVREEAAQPFDLEHGPPMRNTLLRIAEDEHIWLLTMHHLACDGRSIDIFFEEFRSIYEALARGDDFHLPELPVQYADFAVWQRESLTGERLETLSGWWRKQLAGAPPVSTLPADRPRPAEQTFDGRCYPLAFSPGLSRQLRELCRQEQVSLFMAVAAVSHALLYRYSGHEDLVTGATVANRDSDETRGLIGLLVNAVPLRVRITGEMTFRDLLESARETVLGAFAHQDLPFEKLVEAAGVERSLSYSPLFQVAVTVQQAELERMELPGLTVTPLPAIHRQAKYDLTISFTDSEQITGIFEYNTGLFDEATIARATRHFERLIEALVKNPGSRIADTSMLTAAEERQLVVEWNQTAAARPARQILHELFELQADRTPEAVAVSFENHSLAKASRETLSYRGLDRLSNRIAHCLRRLGVQPETRVGIFFRDRSIDMIAAILAVLKAGAAYVPFDPAHPQNRLRFQVADAGIQAVLTDSDSASSLPGLPVRAICLDQQASDIRLMPASRLQRAADPDSIAYVTYTSGSTGKPKGVLVPHAGACNLAAFTAHDFGVGPGSRVLQFAAVTFDACVLETFMALSAGAELCLASRETLRSAPDLFRLLREREISAAILPPTMLRALPSGDLPALRSLMSAGEPCTPDIVKRYARGRCFVNGYGPTESTVAATYHHVEDGEHAGAVIPIGRPLANATVFVLDSRFRPVPVDAVGEIHIAGAGLARGYLNRPALTAERFVPNPFSREPGARMYRSGDMGRFRPGGTIEFLGRADQQVKIRGFRIELGEIEAALHRQPGVGEAVAAVRDDENNNRKLVAFVVPEQEENSRDRSWPGKLRTGLSESLPDYMLPSQIEIVDAIPLTSHGKVDYRALEEQVQRNTEVAPELNITEAPRTQVECELWRIWCEVLGRKEVGIHDNFFELGGDSILSMQIVARASQRGLALTPKHLFQWQTIAELAEIAGKEAAVTAEQTAVIGKTPLTPIQHWFFEQHLEEMHHWNQAAMLEAPASITPERIAGITRVLLDHHDALRAQFSNGGAEIEAPGGESPCLEFDLSHARPEARAAAIEAVAAQVQASLDLAHGPLVRVALLNLDANKRLILIVIHHLVIDSVSWRILLEDFNTAFEQMLEGKPVELPAKTTSFRNWGERLNEYAQSPTLRAELDYWLNEETRAPAPFPLDYPDGVRTNTRHRARTIQLGLNAAETQELLQHVVKTGHTDVPEALLTALAQAGAQWRGLKSMLVDVEAHGRESLFPDVDLSRTVGWFTSVYPVKLNMPISVSFRPGAALKLVREQLRRVPARGIGYGLLRYLCADAAVRRALSELPQPAIGFNYLGQMDAGQQESSAFRPAKESCGPVMSPRGARRHLIEIVASISGGRLLMNWTYHEDIHSRSAIDDLAATHIRMLRLLIAHSKSTGAEIQTPSDFPLAALDDGMLRRISEQLA